MASHLRRTAQDHTSRRQQPNGVNGHAPSSHSTTAAAARAYHNSHAYAVSQQPLFTSWNLPDYLNHLEPMLPTDVPRPLEVRGFGVQANGADAGDRTTERGVKVKWPSKRMSVVDMNKRVRALVEWVGREQANAAERNRRREAVEQALKDAQLASAEALDLGEQHRAGKDSDDAPPPAESGANADSSCDALLSGEKASSALALNGLGPQSAQGTMKQMEELMEELISFQERFGPGAKMKERERRTVAS